MVTNGTQYILCTATPAATTANTWVFSLVLYTGVNMATGTLLPVLTLNFVRL